MRGRVFIFNQLIIMEEKNIPKTSNERELDIIAFWKKNNIFEESLEKKSPNGEFVFYDGPPTANGRPGIHHLEARAFKDAIPRYKTMQGYHVRRKGGWDTHGLPVELEVEKQLGITAKKQIEEYGIDKFNQKCKESVWTYIDEWEKFTYRSAYWVDSKNPYVTYDSSYIESLWSIVKTVEDKKLLYKDYRIVPWCARCGTALSSHELAQGYKDVKDLSVTAKFKVIGQENTFLLAWTTTPWTLPGNVALAVNEKLEYVKILVGSEYFILGKERLSIIEAEYGIVEEFTGERLVGLEYVPLYPYFGNLITGEQKEKLNTAFHVYSADFVTANDGTGIVHTAVMYGQDDFELGTKLGLPKFHLVKEDGHFIDGMDFLSGRFVKDEQVAIDVIKDLANRESGSLLFKKEKYEHSYPHCWRCSTPLVYYARDSWYIRMSSLRDSLVSSNDFINWNPSHIGQGRFGEWLREVKDWAISRERYWGTPLPVWEDSAGSRHVFTNRDELKNATKKSGNKYVMMRHGQAESNLTGICSYATGDVVPLTELGRNQVKKSAEELKDKKIDLIYISPFLRTRQSAEIVADTLGLPYANIIEDKRLIDLNVGIFEGKKWEDYFNFFEDKNRFTEPAPGGETVTDVKRRVGEALYDMDKNVNGKNILILGHGITLWMLESVAKGATVKETMQIREDLNHNPHQDSLPNASWRDLDFTPLPHNLDYELDLHRPYIDEYPVFNEQGEKLTRVKEVMDVWFDSGAMPFAQDGYPRQTDKVHFPADYICEAVDQTRGWFYTLHAVGALTGRGAAYKNVICLGHILDKEGQKMSKSKGNVVNPWDMFEKYGADALRFWMYSVNQPGDSKNFDEKTVDEIVKKVFNLTRNVLAFYELHRDRESEINYSLENKINGPLNLWIISKLNNLISNNTKAMDSFDLFSASRNIREFVDEMSTWYLRRSRDYLRDGDNDTKQTLYLVLKNLALVMAPLSPFTAEELWMNLRTENDTTSVHLADWPKINEIPESEFVLESMEKVRSIVSLGHAMRKDLNIGVRQPLSKLYVDQKIEDEYVHIICDELNVKSVVMGDKIALDSHITEELKSEGMYREFLRYVQDLRKSSSLMPGQIVSMKLSTDMNGKKFVELWKKSLKEEASLSEIIFDEAVDGEKCVVEDLEFVGKFV